jgi:hypothetical protein
MIEISEMVEKPFTSSVKYLSRSLLYKGVGPPPPSPPAHYFPAYPWDISFKDDVTVVLLLDISFMLLAFSIQLSAILLEIIETSAVELGSGAIKFNCCLRLLLLKLLMSFCSIVSQIFFVPFFVSTIRFS